MQYILALIFNAFFFGVETYALVHLWSSSSGAVFLGLILMYGWALQAHLRRFLFAWYKTFMTWEI